MTSYFKNLNIDLTEYTPDPSFNGVHIARFLKKNCDQTTQLKLVTSSGYHHLYYKDKCLIVFFDEMCSFQLYNPYYNDKLIIDIPHYNMLMNYYTKILKNIFFFEYLRSNSNNYFIFEDILINNSLIMDTLFDSCSDYWHSSGITSIFNDNNIIIIHDDFELNIVMRLDKENGFIFQHSIKNKPTFTGFGGFDKFIRNLNKDLYARTIEDIIQIPANEYTIEHRKFVEIIDC